MSLQNPKALPSSALIRPVRRARREPTVSDPLTIQIRVAILTALALIAIISLFPHLQTGFTTKDDSELALLGGRPDQWTDAASKYAAFQARFYLLFTLIGHYLVHYSSNPVLYYSLYLGSILLNVVVFYFLLRTLFQSNLLAVLGAALSLAYLQNNWQHSLLTSYPVILAFGLSNLFLAGIFFYKWRNSRRLQFAVLTGITYFFAALEYEAFLPYFIVFVALAIYGVWSIPDQNVTGKAWTAAKTLSPVIAAVGIYLALYIVFLFLHPPSGYGGTQLAWRGISNVTAVIWQYTSSTLPGYFYLSDPAVPAITFDGYGAPVRSFAGLLDRCRTAWLLKAVVVSVLCGLILLQKRRVFNGQSFFLAIACGCACAIAPVLLLGITVKYQDWVLKAGSQAYVPSYFAYFATIFLISACLLFINQTIARWRILSVGFIVIASVGVAVTSLATDYYNHYVTLDQHLSHLKWRTVDRFMQTNEFKALGNDSIIFAPTLWRRRGIVENDGAYWSRYFSGKSGKRIWVARNSTQLRGFVSSRESGKTYFLALQQEPKEPNQFLVFSKLGLDRPLFSGPVYSREFALFNYSKNKRFTLYGESPRGSSPVKIYVNGRSVDKIEGNAFVARIDQSNTPENFPKTTVQSAAPIDIAHLAVSYFPVEPGRKEVEVAYGKGFHGLEENLAAGVVWNWSLAESELSLVNYSDHPIEKSIQFKLVVLTARTVAFEINGIREEIRLEDGGTRLVHLPHLILQPGENKLLFTSDQPARLVGNGDQRPMAFCVQNLRISHPGQ